MRKADSRPLPDISSIHAKGQAGDAGAPLIVNIDGFEGPLDLLLDLARAHKVDLAHIPILQLADQYLDFIARAKQLNIPLAGQYLVMAAWLVLIKSQLLLPRPVQEEEDGEMLAARLKRQLQQLSAIRTAAARLFSRPLRGCEMFACGYNRLKPVSLTCMWQCERLQLIETYGQLQRRTPQSLAIAPRAVWTLAAARQLLIERLGHFAGWAEFSFVLTRGTRAPATQRPVERRSLFASSFASVLELAREGKVELAQDGAQGPLYLRPVGKACTAAPPMEKGPRR